MRNTLLLIGSAFALVLAACNKDEPLDHQDHDKNKMMALMHQNMMYMDTVPETNDPEIDFARMMIVHHQGAIDMANLELQEGKSDFLKSMARKMIDAQQKEIEQLQTYLNTHSVDNSEPGFLMEHMESMKRMEKDADIQHITGDTDNDFATLMIPHHQSAIDNSYAYLKYGNDDELTALANKIIEDQNKEIQQLADWLIEHRR